MQAGNDEWWEDVEDLSESTQPESDEWAQEAQVEQDIPSSAMSELKKLNQHMGQIEGQVTNLSDKYDKLSLSHLSSSNDDSQVSADELEASDVQTPLETPIDASQPANAQRINKFAKMLKTLQSYKTQYKIASSPEEKSLVHTKVNDFTRKWLDAKNIQLEDSLH